MLADGRPIHTEAHGPGGEDPAWGPLFGDDGSARARRLLSLLLLPAGLFGWTVGFDFVFDDQLVILGDALVTGRLDLSAIFRNEVRVAEVSLGYYRPLITLSYRLDRLLWGLNPAGFHLTNLLWHLAATLLVYRVARESLPRAGAWAAACLFGVLPGHTEAVGWIQGRVDLVSTTLVLAALLGLLRARRGAGRAEPAWLTLAGLAFLAALLAKESAAALPLAWLAWEAAAGSPGPWRARIPGALRRLIPLGLAAVGYGLLRQQAVGGLVAFPLEFSPLLLRLVALGVMLSEYGRILLFPDPGLNFYRALPVALDLASGARAALAALLLGAGLAAAWRWGRSLFPWVAWLPVSLAPVLLFVGYAPAPTTGFFTAERFLYLPSVGYCLLGGSLMGRLLSRRAGPGVPARTGAAFACLLVAYAALTVPRLRPWADPVELYAALLAQSGLTASVRVLVHNNLGGIYLDRGEFAAARREFAATLRLQPDHPLAHNNLGVLLLRQGRPAASRPWLEAAIRLDPGYADAYGNLGAALEALGQPQAAGAAYRQALRLAPKASWLAEGLARTGGGEPAPQEPRP